RSLLVLSSLFLVSQSILNGHADRWTKHPHLVKILARSSSSSPPLACSGTLISPRLVLTASDCVMEAGKIVSEVLVMFTRPTKPPLRKQATLALLNGTLAYLSLAHPMKPEDICPSGIPSGRASLLSIIPSLTHYPVTPFEWDKMDTTTCRMVAFHSAVNVSHFLSSTAVETAVMKGEVEGETIGVKRRNTAEPAACWEDTGAPFECLVGQEFIQVGIFTSLFAPKERQEQRFKRDEKSGFLFILSKLQEVKIDTTTSTTTPESTTTPKKEDKALNFESIRRTFIWAALQEEKTDSTTTSTTPEPTTTAAKEIIDTFAHCLTASSLRFSRLDALSVASVIEKYDFSGFVKMHEKCG
ncbi:hypothetical protein PENTCL1PPCAC_26243, partial [Pristionchus entomophagus]